MDEDQPKSIRWLFVEAERRRDQLEKSWDSNSTAYQENLTAAIATYEECLRVADQVSLYSPNETLDDISSGDLQYMPLNYHLAELILKITGGDRKAYIKRAQICYEKFLKLLDSYDMLSKSDARLLERYLDARDEFSTASTTDAAARREMKISRFKEEKELKRKLEYLRQNPTALENDDAALRQLHMTNVALCVHQAFQSLESCAQELKILALAPPAPPAGQPQNPGDSRQEDRGDAYSERLDNPLVGGLRSSGPILSSDGKPLRPFTLLDNRQVLRQGVFRPDHSLPTMTIDEYLEEEKRRGGIIEGGGEQSGIRPEPNEDDLVAADAETMKARAWDEFKEDNPKGSGNTLNRG
ncbi:type 2A phosphatase-associated protein 42 [Mytilinidion resinicola]|uniref:Type 2A phosphatase-associated protein 42 n=1 Tax=Mytilinidion resinicola TaxID=574789 RepID=A0A6A6Y3H1_9PEZI|nr:type 2A phosphatase-associated protein 42 [Mytilinidion resinicola]KAF2803073.1 type 2A phosphatase-associated protein 42 [Mytilinidion resinicola]